MFEKDNEFLTPLFLEAVSAMLTDGIITASEVETSKINGSYYNFYIKTKKFLIVPIKMRFVLVYLNYLKLASPEYFNNTMEFWNKTLIANNRTSLIDLYKNETLLMVGINEFDNYRNTNPIFPKIITETDYYTVYENLEYLPKISGNIITLNRFKKLYEKVQPTQYSELYIFPTNDISYYRIDENKQLKLIYPIFNSYKWNYILPDCIYDPSAENNYIYFNKNNKPNELLKLLN